MGIRMFSMFVFLFLVYLVASAKGESFNVVHRPCDKVGFIPGNVGHINGDLFVQIKPNRSFTS
jgi:hypothetical protein